MTTRAYIQNLDDNGELIRISESISTQFELAGVLKSLEPAAVLFENVKDSEFGVIGNLFCTKKSFADYLNFRSSQIIPRLLEAIQNPSACKSYPMRPARRWSSQIRIWMRCPFPCISKTTAEIT